MTAFGEGKTTYRIADGDTIRRAKPEFRSKLTVQIAAGAVEKCRLLSVLSNVQYPTEKDAMRRLINCIGEFAFETD